MYVKTFVDSLHYKGTCQQLIGLYTGKTKGYGKLDVKKFRFHGQKKIRYLCINRIKGSSKLCLLGVAAFPANPGKRENTIKITSNVD
jgi:hypothetical protein